MNLDLNPGKYVIAVSGGVDSVVLLHALSKKKDVELIVAHYDHGIRDDSKADRIFVQNLAEKQNLRFFYEEGSLGKNASEDLARAKRYDFLHRVKTQTKAAAIVTAHHQDDLLETVIFNLLRGTGRLGLASLRSTHDISRPLLGYTKSQIKKYAEENSLDWREDSTNEDLRYSRNYIRHKILPLFTDNKREKMLELVKRTESLNMEINNELETLNLNASIDRSWFISLPHAVSVEVLAYILRINGVREITSHMLNRLVTGAKTLRPGLMLDVDSDRVFIINKDTLELKPRK